MRLLVPAVSAYRILVTASRTWRDWRGVHAKLAEAERRAWDLGYRQVVVVHGGAKGGDTMADDWTRFPSPLPGMTRLAERYPLAHADWYPRGKFDPSVGSKRNARMVALGAHEALGFADKCCKTTCHRRKPHDSHGTADCLAQARAAGIPAERIASW